MPTDIISSLSQFGVLGIVLAIIFYAYFAKDKEVKAAKQEFIDYLLAKGERDGELKNQLLTFMQTMTQMMTQSKK